MLMVVFGAGASYDSVPSRPPRPLEIEGLYDRPPLADQLFDDRPRFVEAVSRFHQCQAIIPRLRHRAPNVSIESVLETLQAEAEEYPERYKQLAALRYYLHFMIWECERFWNEVAQGVTNHKTLLDQIELWRHKSRERVCLVTFNYDRMLEAVLPTVGVNINGLADYIAGDTYRLVKLHGSVNWAREVDTSIENLNDRNAWQVAYEPIDRAADLKISQRYRVVTEHPIGKLDRTVLFPALAIPVESKRSYECPPEHLDALQACIPEVTKLLLIGWRATERPFLRLLAENLRPGTRTLVVAGGEEKAATPLENLQLAGVPEPLSAAKGGFSEFVVGREAKDFLGG